MKSDGLIFLRNANEILDSSSGADLHNSGTFYLTVSVEWVIIAYFHVDNHFMNFNISPMMEMLEIL